MMNSNEIERIERAVSELDGLLHSFDSLHSLIIDAAQRIEASIRKGGKVMLFGNGGSSSQAQHIAAEFVNRFLKDRVALPAMALTTDQSILTSVANDIGFETIFSRQIEALGKPGDVAIGLSTSGNSPNVRAAFNVARSLRILTIGLTGRSGGELAKCSDIEIRINSISTPRIQEMHLLVGHLVAEMVEAGF